MWCGRALAVVGRSGSAEYFAWAEPPAPAGGLHRRDAGLVTPPGILDGPKKLSVVRTEFGLP